MISNRIKVYSKNSQVVCKKIYKLGIRNITIQILLINNSIAVKTINFLIKNKKVQVTETNGRHFVFIMYLEQQGNKQINESNKNNCQPAFRR